MIFEPRYYQSEAVDAIFKYFYSNDGNPLVVLPTGSGKSLVQAMIADRLITEYPQSRILFLTHQQELIRQNYDELIFNYGICDAGIYSAGLKCRDTFNQIIFAGIQSVYKRAMELGAFNLIVIDECHLVPKSGNGMYLSFLADMKKIFNSVKVVGMTATEYRLDSGLLTDGKDRIFTDVCYKAHVRDLIDKGYLCKLIGKNGAVRPDVSRVKRRGGDFVESELAQVCDDAKIVRAAVSEIIELAADRKHILIFCAGIQHAQHVAEEMTAQGRECRVVHSQMPESEKQKVIDDFKSGVLPAVANVNMLTTGFNARHIDCIPMLRPTESTGLYYQMCGRGLRNSDGKEDCLILDYAGNILRHGPIDKIEVKSSGRLGGESAVKTAPQKECPKCKGVLPIAVVECPECGYLFPVTAPHGEEAHDVAPLSQYKPPYEYDIENIIYSLHEKNGNFSMRVTYYTGALQSVSEWVCIEHDGFAKKKAIAWFRECLHPGVPIPDSVEDALGLREYYRKPEKVLVDYNEKFPRIIARLYPVEQEQEETTGEEVAGELAGIAAPKSRSQEPKKNFIR